MGFSYFLYQFIQKLPAKRGTIVEERCMGKVYPAHIKYMMAQINKSVILSRWCCVYISCITFHCTLFTSNPQFYLSKCWNMRIFIWKRIIHSYQQKKYTCLIRGIQGVFVGKASSMPVKRQFHKNIQNNRTMLQLYSLGIKPTRNNQTHSKNCQRLKPSCILLEQIARIPGYNFSIPYYRVF